MRLLPIRLETRRRGRDSNPRALRPTVFKTASINHSDTPPSEPSQYTTRLLHTPSPRPSLGCCCPAVRRSPAGQHAPGRLAAADGAPVGPAGECAFAPAPAPAARRRSGRDRRKAGSPVQSGHGTHAGGCSGASPAAPPRHATPARPILLLLAPLAAAEPRRRRPPWPAAHRR